MKRLLLSFILLALFIPVLPTVAQETPCELTNVYVLLLQAQIQLNQNNTAGALEILKEVQTALDMLQTDCGGVGETPAPATGAPIITMTEDNNFVTGTVSPSSFCNSKYKIAIYSEVDTWYVQPFADTRKDVQIGADCSWSTSVHNWSRLSAHVVTADYDIPITSSSHTCPPLSSEQYSEVLAGVCYP